MFLKKVRLDITMKVIFLDFDGVLNCEKYISQCGKYGVTIDETKMQLLKKLVDKTNAEIVLTTSWREHWEKDTDKCDATGIEINDIFAKYGLYIYGKTKKLNARREKEIDLFVIDSKEVENYVVFDDCYLSSDIIDGHFIKTSYYKDGLEEEHILKAITILGRKNK